MKGGFRVDSVLTAVHWVYLLFIILIFIFLTFRKDLTIVCLVGICIMTFIVTGSIPLAISGLFVSIMYAIQQLLPIILVISIITSMSKVLMYSGISDWMISPFTKIIKTPTRAFWTTGFLMMGISTFFWPSPAIALLGAVLLPVALRVGLPAIGAAMAMNLFGHGIALSSDFIIQAAPKISADAAGLPVSEVMTATVPLLILMGAVTTITAFLMLTSDMKKGKLVANTLSVIKEKDSENAVINVHPTFKRIFSLLVPLLFLFNIVVMASLKLQGGEATALIGGTSIFILILTTVITHRERALEQTTNYLIEGLQFGFRVFGPVIPIAAFFYLGGGEFTEIIGNDLPPSSNGIVTDLGGALAQLIPITETFGALVIVSVGTITGLDGSGFSGLPLTGAIASLFGQAIGSGTAILTALGQITTIWIGGGTIIPWALIPAAAICQVDPFELARRNLIPVTVGLIVTTVFAIFLM